MQYKRIIVTGSLSHDYIMSMPTRFKDHIMPDKIHILNVSFIMKKFQREYGGTAGNIAYSLSLLGVPSIIVATAGNDFDVYMNHLLKNARLIDTKGIKIIKNIPTASGFVMTDRSDNQIWGFYEGAMKKSSILKLKNYYETGDFLVIAPNDPHSMRTLVVDAIRMKVPFLYDPAFNIPHFSNQELNLAITNAEILIGNDYEIALIKRKLNLATSELIKKVKILVITKGSLGLEVIDRNQKITVRASKPDKISDPTGAGDAFRSGFLTGIFLNKSLKTAAQMGALTATYTVEKYGTQTHKFSRGSFSERYIKNYNEKLSFDSV